MKIVTQGVYKPEDLGVALDAIEEGNEDALEALGWRWHKHPYPTFFRILVFRGPHEGGMDETTEWLVRLGVAPESALDIAETMENLEAVRIRNPSRVSRLLMRINHEIEAYGIEDIRDPEVWDNYWHDTVAAYVNTGDAYNATVLWDVGRNQFWCTTYGDWLERREREREVARDNEPDEDPDEDPDPYDGWDE